MESYNDFLARIGSFQHRNLTLGDSYFNANSSVQAKAHNDGSFRAFYGDTVVFDLDESTKNKLSYWIDYLYENAGECFCKRLVPQTLHMTLHDLSCSQTLENIACEIFENELRIHSVRKTVSSEKIRMKSSFIFNMVGASLVVGLYPADEREYEKLMKLYEKIDSVRSLSYPFTPHITLAYFRPTGFDRSFARQLENAVNLLNEQSIELTLDTDKLYYQKFTDMNSYYNILSFSEQ